MSQMKNFTIIPNDVVRDIQLSIYEKMVYMVLSNYADYKTKSCYPSYETIAKYAGCSRRKVIEAVKRLVELKLVTKFSKKVGCKNSHACNLYVLNIPSNSCRDQEDIEEEVKIENAASLPGVEIAFPKKYISLPDAVEPSASETDTAQSHTDDSFSESPSAAPAPPSAPPALKRDPLNKTNQIDRSIDPAREEIPNSEKLTEALDKHFDSDYFSNVSEYSNAYNTLTGYMAEMLSDKKTKIGSCYMSRDSLKQIIFKADSVDLADFIEHLRRIKLPKITNPKAYFKTALIEYFRQDALLYPKISRPIGDSDHNSLIYDKYSGLIEDLMLSI